MQDFKEYSSYELVPVGKPLILGTLGNVCQNDTVKISFSSNNPAWTEKGGTISEIHHVSTHKRVLIYITKLAKIPVNDEILNDTCRCQLWQMLSVAIPKE